MPIEKAQMRLRIVLPKECAKKTREKLEGFFTSVESEDWDCGQLDIVSAKRYYKQLRVSCFSALRLILCIFITFQWVAKQLNWQSIDR